MSEAIAVFQSAKGKLAFDLNGRYNLEFDARYARILGELKNGVITLHDETLLFL